VDKDGQAPLSFNCVSFQTDEQLLAFLMTLGFCGRGRYNGAALPGRYLKNPALTIDLLNGRHDGVALCVTGLCASSGLITELIR
jgi:hypothetical protein